MFENENTHVAADSTTRTATYAAPALTEVGAFHEDTFGALTWGTPDSPGFYGQ